MNPIGATELYTKQTYYVKRDYVYKRKAGEKPRLPIASKIVVYKLIATVLEYNEKRFIWLRYYVFNDRFSHNKFAFKSDFSDAKRMTWNQLKRLL